MSLFRARPSIAGAIVDAVAPRRSRALSERAARQQIADFNAEREERRKYHRKLVRKRHWPMVTDEEVNEIAVVVTESLTRPVGTNTGRLKNG